MDTLVVMTAIRGITWEVCSREYPPCMYFGSIVKRYSRALGTIYHTYDMGGRYMTLLPKGFVISRGSPRAVIYP